MRNQIQAGVNLTLPAPTDVASGDGVAIGSIFGVAAIDATTGTDVDVVTEGVFELPKVATTVFTIGDPLYWDVTAKLVTKTANGNTKIGVAVTPAANPSGFVNVRLVPTV